VDNHESELAQSVNGAMVGDSAGWDDLVDRFSGLIWAVARGQGLSTTDAAEVSQTTWLRLAEHIGEITDPLRVGAWLATTARREAIRIARLGARYVLVDPWEYVDHSVTEDDLDTGIVHQERDLVIRQALALLPTRCRELLTALVLSDPPLSYRQLSEDADMAIGSIGPTRGRCLEHLRELIATVEAGAVPMSALAEGRP
jgi:RNA polymerase sigma factor (sigma-70 family)